MARVSRKQQTRLMPEIVERIYHTALYVRLSKEDSGYDNSDSIEMQKYLLEQYVRTQVDMQIAGVFCDNGSTGTNFDRPDFERMMEAIRRREIDCIVVKDLSRFGRNYVETGYYLEKIFPFLGVRFVAVNDAYDTLKSPDGDGLVVSLKNIVNSLFAKDISKKSGSALKRKQEKGEFIGGFTPYGYLKSPEDKHRLIIDMETAAVVRDIFTQRLENVGYAMIARRLNEQQIPCPNRLRYLRGEFKKTQPSSGCAWQPQTIKLITNNMVYAGHMAQGKEVRSLCDGILPADTDKSDWIIVYHTHEPLVDEDTWNRVQDINEQKKTEAQQKQGQNPTTANILVGLVFCKDCGRPMIRNKGRSKKGAVRYTFICRNYRENRNLTGCTLKSVGEPELFDWILKSIRVQIAITVRQEQLLEKLKADPRYLTERKDLERKIQRVQTDISQNTTNRSRLFEGYSDKTLTNDEYLYMKQQYDEKANDLAAEQARLLKLQKTHEKDLSPQNAWIKSFRKYVEIDVLTRDIALELIHHITISDYNEIEVVWNFKDEFQTLLGYTQRVTTPLEGGGE